MEQAVDGSSDTDCVKGLVILNPDPQTVMRYREEGGGNRGQGPSGLHVRPASQLAECAAAFECEIYINHKGHQVNGKSTIGLLTLNAPFGSRLEVTCTGPDADAALEAIQKIPI